MNWGVGGRHPRRSRARWVAAVIALAAVGGGLWLVLTGQVVEGTVIAFAGMAPYALFSLDWAARRLVPEGPEPSPPPAPVDPSAPTEKELFLSQDTPVIVYDDPLPAHGEDPTAPTLTSRRRRRRR